MKNNIKKYLLAAAGAGLMLTACDIERLPNGSMAAESITSDPDANLESLVRGAYAQLKTWSDPMHRLGRICRRQYDDSRIFYGCLFPIYLLFAHSE